MHDLSNKAALVTGASSGIGEATAVALAERGVRIALAARREDRLGELVSLIEREGGRAIAIRCDVSDRVQVQRAVEKAAGVFGAIDILINNAGVMPVSPIAAGRFADWDRMIDVNIRGVLHGIGAVLPMMLERRTGHIVNVSSVAGRFVFPGNAVYCGTKHMVHAISEGLRSELAQMDPPQTGIRVTVIAPGVVHTELPDSTTDEAARVKVREYYDTMEGALQSEDIAAAILYALQAPRHVNVNELLLRPTAQVR
jgi:NADP-dependent 3-hydroxy acid dehydrogenase YdfG